MGINLIHVIPLIADRDKSNSIWPLPIAYDDYNYRRPLPLASGK